MPEILVISEPAATHSFPGHPESPERVYRIQRSLLADAELARMLTHVSDVHPLPMEAFHTVHSAQHLRWLDEICSSGVSDPQALRDADDPDGPTYATSTTFTFACYAAAAASALVNSVRSGTGPTAGLSLCRPPGHHATKVECMGFCLINSIAVAARHCQRPAIVDIDVHHGNGTQDIFYDDPNVLFIDVHRDGVWPGTGTLNETGFEAGVGSTINVPLPAYSGHAAALSTLERVIAPALRRFKPDIILISAGFDAHYADPLECLQFLSCTYHALFSGLKDLAIEVCGGRCVAVLEGG